MNKINIADLLRDCPSGMELDCASYDNVSFDKISEDKKATYPIFCYITDEEGNRSGISFTENGCESKRYGAKCVIFPKGKNTWEGFVPPCKFKDGDIVYIKTKGYNQNEFIIIFKEIKNDHIHKHACFAYQVLYTSKNAVCHLVDVEEVRLATEEEKNKLFEAIKNNGYRWDIETKTLEKLIKPYFKVGDKIKHKCDKNNTVITITGSIHDYYYIQYYNNMKNEYQNEAISFTDQDKYELIIDKFDINTLKPFDKVLVRTDNKHIWTIQFFERLNNILKDSFVCMGGARYRQCIPYEGNEHLLGTTEDCDEYFKTWLKTNKN